MKTTKNNKTIFRGNRIMESVNRMITEGELENAEAALAAKDLVDRIQDVVGDLGKMSNEELPSLVDAIRNSFGADAATQYQASANAQINTLLNAAKVAKDELNNSTLVLTGDESAQVSGGAPEGDAPGSGEEAADTNDADTLDSLDDEDGFDATAPAAGGDEPLGRGRREATEESRLRKEYRIMESTSLLESVKSIKNRLETEKNKIATLRKKAKGEADSTNTKKKIKASQEKIKTLQAEFTEAKKKTTKLSESRKVISESLQKEYFPSIKDARTFLIKNGMKPTNAMMVHGPGGEIFKGPIRSRNGWTAAQIVYDYKGGKETPVTAYITVEEKYAKLKDNEDATNCTRCGGSGKNKMGGFCKNCRGTGQIITTRDNVSEAKKGKKPAFLEKAEVKAEKKEGKKVSTQEKKKVDEAARPAHSSDRSTYGVRWTEFAGKEDRATTKEKYFHSEAAMNKFVEKLEEKGNFWKIEGYTYPEKKKVEEATTKKCEKCKKAMKACSCKNKKVKEDVDSKSNNREKAHDITDKTANSYTSEKALEKAPRFTDNVYDVNYKPSNSNKGGVYEAKDTEKKCKGKGCKKKITGKGTMCPGCKKKGKLKESREHTLKLAEMLASKKKVTEAIDSSAESDEYEVYFRNNATGKTSSKSFFGISLNDVENQASKFIRQANSQGDNDLELIDIHSVEHDDEEAGIEDDALPSQYRNFSSDFGG